MKHRILLLIDWFALLFASGLAGMWHRRPRLWTGGHRRNAFVTLLLLAFATAALAQSGLTRPG